MSLKQTILKMPGKFLYFAYGSNLWSERIRLNNRSAVMKTCAVLRGYKLEFGYMSQRWKGAAANVIPDPKSEVYGVLWEMAMEDQESLDTQEGVNDGIYQKLQIKVETTGGDMLPCVAYQITKATRDKSRAEYGEDLKPSIVYKNVIIRGAKENNLPAEYITFLENIPDNGYNGEVDVNISLKEQ